MKPYSIICEALQTTKVKFIIHSHDSRKGSSHYDLRFLDPRDPKLLHSFAAPKNFLDTLNTRSVIVKTRDHDPRWLTLKSYRLKEIDKGEAIIKIATKKYFEIDFNGKVLKGSYKLFKIKTRRDDNWMLVRK